jgi:hypothetical protein
MEIQGSGRVAKYRHLLYEWLGVDKVELAVMAELLLRGAQTEGELRGRASRMEPIADLNVLRGILDSLRAKHLVLDLTPAGRGQIISHALYEPEELERLRENRCRRRLREASPRRRQSAALLIELTMNYATCVPSSPKCAANWNRSPKRNGNKNGR